MMQQTLGDTTVPNCNHVLLSLQWEHLYIDRVTVSAGQKPPRFVQNNAICDVP